VLLTRNQEIAVNVAFSGHSFFLTGKGGTGKRFVINRIYRDLLNAHKKVFVTCSTGIAGTNLGTEATTIHSFAGIKDGRGSKDILLKLVQQNDEAFR